MRFSARRGVVFRFNIDVRGSDGIRSKVEERRLCEVVINRHVMEPSFAKRD